MKKIHALIATALIAASGFFASCDNDNCVLSNVAYAYFGFYNERGGAVALADTVSVVIAGIDSTIVNRDVNPSEFSLPLRYTSTLDTFVVIYTGTMRDTLFVTHENIPHYMSMDCGVGMYYNIQQVETTHNAIDSAVVVNSYVTYDANENVKLYFTAGD